MSFIAIGQTSFKQPAKNYLQFQQEFVNLKVVPDKINLHTSSSQQIENGPVIIGAIVFVGVMTLSKFSEENHLSDGAYYATCGLIISSATLYCILNKEHKYKPYRRR